MTLLIVKLSNAILVPAGVQLAIRQKFCILLLQMLKCYNSTAPNWYHTLSEWHYHVCQKAKTIAAAAAAAAAATTSGCIFSITTTL
jgi:hypothetical protein